MDDPVLPEAALADALKLTADAPAAWIEAAVLIPSTLGDLSAIERLASDGRSVLVATHDVEFVAAAADRVVVMAEGDIVADGPTAAVVGASPAFAPQVAKIMAPLAYLTVDQVRRALPTVAPC